MRGLVTTVAMTVMVGGSPLVAATAAHAAVEPAAPEAPVVDGAPVGFQPVYTPVVGGGTGPSGAASSKKPKPPKITYHGGATMAAPAGTNTYVIWYGNWPNAAAKSIVTTFLADLSGSKYMAINNAYTNAAKKKIVNKYTFAGQTTDAYSRGATNLAFADIQASVATAIGNGALPKDPDGVYFVLTSSDVTVTDFKAKFCGWHTHATIGGTDIKYSFVGDANKSSACTVQLVSSPNNNPQVDAMLSVIAHELAETVTDPNHNGWYDANGDENADKCAWTFGKELVAASGAKYNVTLNSRNYYLQQNWKKAGGCALR